MRPELREAFGLRGACSRFFAAMQTLPPRKRRQAAHLSLKPLMLDIQELLNDSLLQKFLGP
jgi:hypothetical protein